MTRPGGLPTNRADTHLDATPTERALASQVLLAEAAEVLTDAGVLKPSRTVLDLTLPEVQALAAALGKLASQWPQPALEHRPLGDVLKVIPQEDAGVVFGFLVWGGWLQGAPTMSAGHSRRVEARNRRRADRQRRVADSPAAAADPR